MKVTLNGCCAIMTGGRASVIDSTRVECTAEEVAQKVGWADSHCPHQHALYRP